MCGPEQKVILHMHDREAAAQNLAAVQMELDDLASDLLLRKLSITHCIHCITVYPMCPSINLRLRAS